MTKKNWNKNLRSKCKSVAAHVEFKHNCTEMLSKIQSIWDSDLSRTNIANYRTKLSSADMMPTHSAPYQAVPKACEFRKSEIKKKNGVWEAYRADLHRKSSTNSVRDVEDGFRHFCVDWQKLTAVTKREVKPIPSMDGLSTCLIKPQSFLWKVWKVRIGKWRSRMEIEARPLLPHIIDFMALFKFLSGYELLPIRSSKRRMSSF